MDFLGVFLNKEETSSLYYQLYIYLVNEIQSGNILAGEKLPAKRNAAQQLGLSVNTVDTAYQMLAAEGYVVARPRSGFIVSQLEQLVPLPRSASANSSSLPLVAEVESNKKTMTFSFSSGGVDLTLFPQKIWNRIFRDVLSGGSSLFEQGNPAGDIELRHAIADYLQSYRGVRCKKEQIVFGAGLEVLTGMLVRLFPSKKVAVETPGYTKSAHIVENMGLSVVPISLDHEGMLPEQLVRSGAQVAYLTPSHQFPTGAVMPVGRRTTLLQWAAKGQNLIIEDDYDSEFRFDGRPLPCLQGLDAAGHVIYAGTFSRVLAPGLRAAYLVLPEKQLAEWKTAYGDYACTVSRPEQQTLARFIQGGHFSRHLNRIRSAYKARRNLLIKEIEKQFSSISYSIHNAHTGLYFILRLPGKNGAKIADACRKQGIGLHATSEYSTSAILCIENDFQNDLILGYGGLAKVDIPLAVSALLKCIDNDLLNSK